MPENVVAVLAFLLASMLPHAAGPSSRHLPLCVALAALALAACSDQGASAPGVGVRPMPTGWRDLGAPELGAGVYDGARGRVVSVAWDMTWEYDGQDWARVGVAPA